MTDEEFRPNSTLARLYPEASVGGFSRLDGQIEFYTRVLDFGAGRGHWAVDPMPPMSRKFRWLKGRVAEFVGTDVDPAVLTNPSLDSARVVELGDTLPFEDGSFDMVIADYVLEHVSKADAPRHGEGRDACVEARRVVRGEDTEQVGDDRPRRTNRAQQSSCADRRQAPESERLRIV